MRLLKILALFITWTSFSVAFLEKLRLYFLIDFKVSFHLWLKCDVVGNANGYQ